jgi:hypothetical protein
MGARYFRLRGSWRAGRTVSRAARLALGYSARAAVPQDQSTEASEGPWVRAISYGLHPRSHAATPSPISNPFGTYIHRWPGSMSQIVAAARLTIKLESCRSWGGTFLRVAGN